MKLFLIIALLSASVLQTCNCYKLRRDIGKVKYYCNDICKSCGGEGVLNFDVCVCNFKKETADTGECLDKNGNKFDFLGIRWEVNHGSVKKRSVSNSNYPDFADGESVTENLEQNAANNQLSSSSHNFPESGNSRFQCRLVENQENMREKISHPRMNTDDDDTNLGPSDERTNRSQTKLDLTAISRYEYIPIAYQLRKANFDRLHGGLEVSKRQFLSKIMENLKNHENYQDNVEDETYSSSEYDD